MISGFATPNGTQHSPITPELTFNPLGHAGLWLSGAGFGCYRINADVVAHAKALQKALTSGINLIDTRANDADSGSEPEAV